MGALTFFEATLVFSLSLLAVLSIFPLWRICFNRGQKRHHRNPVLHFLFDTLYVERYPYGATVLWCLIFAGAVMQMHGWLFIADATASSGQECRLWLDFTVRGSAASRMQSALAQSAAARSAATQSTADSRWRGYGSSISRWCGRARTRRC